MIGFSILVGLAASAVTAPQWTVRDKTEAGIATTCGAYFKGAAMRDECVERNKAALAEVVALRRAGNTKAITTVDACVANQGADAAYRWVVIADCAKAAVSDQGAVR